MKRITLNCKVDREKIDQIERSLRVIEKESKKLKELGIELKISSSTSDSLMNLFELQMS